MKGHGEVRLYRNKKPQTRKEPYATPRLVIHGDLKDITRTLGGGATDGTLGSQVSPD